MAFKLYTVPPIGSSKIDIVSSTPTGAETITASVPVGSIGIVLEDTAAFNQNEIINALDQLRDFFMEQNK